jgi:hypothetical protein
MTAHLSRRSGDTRVNTADVAVGERITGRNRNGDAPLAIRDEQP